MKVGALVGLYVGHLEEPGFKGFKVGEAVTTTGLGVGALFL